MLALVIYVHLRSNQVVFMSNLSEEILGIDILLLKLGPMVHFTGNYYQSGGSVEFPCSVDHPWKE